LLAFLLHLQHKGADCLEEENRLRKNKKKQKSNSKIQISYLQQQLEICNASDVSHSVSFN
jgi:hypothetical protein